MPQPNSGRVACVTSGTIALKAVAALAAKGRSEIRRVYHLDRGYHAFEQKLNQLGAKIQRTNDGPQNTAPRPHIGPVPFEVLRDCERHARERYEQK